MKLDALDGEVAVADAHYRAVRGAARHDEAVRQGVGLDDERVVAGRLEALVEAGVDALAVVQDLRGLSVDGLAAHDPGPEGLPDGLVPQAHPEQRRAPAGFLYQLDGDPRLVGRARPGRDDYPVGAELRHLLGRYPVVAAHKDLGAELPQVLDEVVRKGVVVVYDEDPHEHRDFSRYSPDEQGGGLVTLLLTEAEVEELLDMPATLDAVEAVLRQQAEGRATNRARRRVALPKTGLNVMFAGAPDLDALGLKAYTIARGGARFYTMLFDPESGELLSILQSEKLGQMRTGAASGVATKPLAREGANTLGIYGAGWQAESQLEAIAAVRDLDRVIVYSRSAESRKEFAEKMGGRLGMDIETTHAAEEPAAQDIVVTVTSSREPVLLGEWLRPGAHINAAGSNFLFKAEIDREVVRRASFVCADSREELGLEAGDLMQPLETGAILPEAVYELGQVIAGQVPGRRGPEDITLFASQGLALEDMAAARVVYDRAVERDVGRDIDF